VVLANNWMNGPTGFRLMEGGRPVDVDPLAAMFSPGWQDQVTHALLASYLATAAAVTAIHAFLLLRDAGEPGQAHHRRFHGRALGIALGVLCVSAVLQPLTGHRLGQVTARRQPVKLAAMEAHFQTERRAPSRLFGVPDLERHVTRYTVEIPGMLSLLAHDRMDAEVKGLLEFPRADWPPVAVVHYAFQLMVASGTALMGLGLLGAAVALQRWRRRRSGGDPATGWPRWLLWLLVCGGPLGFLALEAGWVVTEVGRQPWIIQGVMRTREAVTPTQGLGPRFAVFTGIYLILGVVAAVMLARHVAAARHLRQGEEGGA
jgi:cytochrome d ubiquinol oxidase subunit I